jgi:hypothetical protein
LNDSLQSIFYNIFDISLFNSIYYFQIFFVIITAIYDLGQASPHLQTLAQARVAAYNIWNAIDAVSEEQTAKTYEVFSSFWKL